MTTVAFNTNPIAKLLSTPLSSHYYCTSRHQLIHTPCKLRISTFQMAVDYTETSASSAGNESADPGGLYETALPFKTDFLQVDDTHAVYYEISGNPNGLPIVFIHGGPGGGTTPSHRRFFDPKVYKIILFDQRGSGNSSPVACLKDNTTWDLVRDMEEIRKAIGIEQWILFGGSWGSTLAVVYAQEHPNRVIAMILRGIFMVRRKELEWLFERSGAALLHPEDFDRYLNGLPERLRNSKSLVHAYYEILKSDVDSMERRRAANAWSNWELVLSSYPSGSLRPYDPDIEEQQNDFIEENLKISRLECHYFVHNGFFEEDGWLLKDENMAKVRNIKTCIVQGRWDMVCPRATAYDLAKKFNKDVCEVIIQDNAGHSSCELGISRALVNAADRFSIEFSHLVKNSVVQ